MARGDQLGFDLRFDDWAERLAREFAIVLMPRLKESMTRDDCRALGGRLAMLASRRAREAGELRDACSIVSCSGCGQSVDVKSSSVLCPTCCARVGSEEM